MVDLKDFSTADLCDEYPDLRVCESMFSWFGTRRRIAGSIVTLKLFEDNSLVREILEQEGEARVFVVDGGGSKRCALVGDNIAKLIENNHWAGVVVYGCIRDSAVIAEMDVGVMALGTHPKKSIKRGEGERDLVVSFGGVTFQPGDHLFADADGLVVSAVPI